MRTVLIRAAAVVLAGALASSVHAADVRPAAAPAGPEVHKMVILNGPNYTAHYFSVGLSTSDQAALRDLENAENNADYAGDLQALRRQYVAQELTLAPHRAAVQRALYGEGTTRSYDYQTARAFAPSYYGGIGSYPGYLNNGYYGNAFDGGFYGYGHYGYGGRSSFADSAATVSQSLAYGVGDEGALKTAMARVIAGQANSEFSTSAARAYTTAMNRAGESDALRTAMGMNPRGVSVASGEQPRHVVVTLKAGAGDKVDGSLVDEDNDWITVATATGEVSVRKVDAVRVERLKK